MYERLLDKSIMPEEATIREHLGEESQLLGFLRKTRELWENRYPCGESGGWIHYKVLADDELIDVIKLLAIRKKPFRV